VRRPAALRVEPRQRTQREGRLERAAAGLELKPLVVSAGLEWIKLMTRTVAAVAQRVRQA